MLARRYSNLSPWEEMERLQREINQLFDTPFSRRFSASGFPQINIWSNEDGAVLTAEVPGIDIKDIEISVLGQNLTLRGERKLDEVDNDKVRYHRQERSFGSFVRTIELPFLVDADKVEARLDKGVLTIKLPRTETDRPHKISVKAI